MSRWTHLNIFPDEVINLQREIAHYHPKLQERLANHPAHEWEVKLAEIGSYCSVILDGDYTEEDVVRLCGLLEKKLITMREDNRSVIIIDI